MNNADTGFKPRLSALVVGSLGSLIIGGVVPYTNVSYRPLKETAFTEHA